MYNKCIYGFFFSFSVFVIFFFYLIHISQMDIIMTAKHVMHNIFFFCLFSINITEAIYNLDSNKTSTIHLNPCFSNDFSFSSDKCIVVFHFLKYYTVKKRKTNKKNLNMYSFTFSCNSGGLGVGVGVQQLCSATICHNTIWSWQNGIVQCLQLLCLTQRVLITVVHDMISTYSQPKNAATQVFTFH